MHIRYNYKCTFFRFPISSSGHDYIHKFSNIIFEHFKRMDRMDDRQYSPVQSTNRDPSYLLPEATQRNETWEWKIQSERYTISFMRVLTINLCSGFMYDRKHFFSFIVFFFAFLNNLHFMRITRIKGGRTCNWKCSRKYWELSEIQL